MANISQPEAVLSKVKIFVVYLFFILIGLENSKINILLVIKTITSSKIITSVDLVIKQKHNISESLEEKKTIFQLAWMKFARDFLP